MVYPINEEMVKRLQRGIDFANEQFDKHYPDVEMHWSIIDGFLTWNKEFALIKITGANVIPILTVFEKGIGHQVVANPSVVDCRLVPDHVVNGANSLK